MFGMVCDVFAYYYPSGGALHFSARTCDASHDFHDFPLIFMIFHWFWRHILVQNHGYVDRKSWIFMKCMQLQGAVAPSSVNRFELPDMFLVTESRDLANGRDLIRCDSRHAAQNLRNVRTFSAISRIRDIDRPNISRSILHGVSGDVFERRMDTIGWT